MTFLERRFSIILLALSSSLSAVWTQKGAPEVSASPFGTLPDGSAVTLYTLRNAKGLEAQISDYGGIVVALRVPDRDGHLDDVVLGYDSLAPYFENKSYFGALVGRYANRIAHGRFTLDGETFQLAKNNGENHLHGGIKGLAHSLWRSQMQERKDGPALILRYTSPDGEDGYPGNLSITVVYALTNRNELAIEYEAEADKPTIINLTHHSYFNLAGAGSGSISMHDLEIEASRFTPVDQGLIPTGELRSVEGTPMDFRRMTMIGAHLNDKDEQLLFAKGYDHNWVLDKPEGQYGLAARLYEGQTGRLVEVYTTEPGIQFYSGNFLDGSERGKGGTVYGHRFGLCLETQHFPDSPNHENFPSTVLRPGQKFKSMTIYRFLTR